MAEVRPIHTPFRQHLRRLRFQLLPVLTFGGALVLSLWLWRHQTGIHASGEAEVARIELTAPADGMIVPIQRPMQTSLFPEDGNAPFANQWHLFDTVTKGQLMARLDDAPSRAALETLRKTVAQLQKELTATDARVRQEFAAVTRDQADSRNQALLQLRRLALDVEGLRMAVLDREAIIETDKLELQRQNDRYDAIEKLASRGRESQAMLWDVTLERDVVKKRIETNERVLVEARSQLKSAQERDAGLRKSLSFPTTQPASLDTFLAPVRAAIAIEEARMGEVRQRINALDIRAPFGGMIREIFRRPGQTVRMGEIIMVLAAGETSHVLTYVREHHRIGPKIGMRVKLRVRTLPVRMVEGHIDQIGPQVVRVPLQHLRDPQMPEWGLPVRIAIPPDCGILPGEIVDITFFLDHGSSL